MRPLALAAAAAAAALVAAGTARADSLPAAVLAEVKAATVFIKVRVGSARLSGSGFLLRAEGDTGLVVTNEHVAVPPPSLTGPVARDVVFHSGRQAEFTTSAELVAADAARDLAVLRVKGVKSLPRPLVLERPAELSETLPVFVFGYPLGEVLASNSRSPAVTVGRGSVSSVRENDRGETALVQIDGDLNPGNSGGPVVDAAGRLVGVAVAAFRGTRIGLAIPPVELQRMLNGRVGSVTRRVSRASAEEAEVAVEVRLIDPLNKITNAGVRVARATAAPTRADKDGRWPALADSRLVPLKVEGQKATGTVVLKSEGRASDSYHFQPEVVNGTGETVRVDPGASLAVTFSTDAPRSAALPGPGRPPAPEGGQSVAGMTVTRHAVGEGVGPACLCWAAGHMAFYHLDAAGTVRRLSYPGVEEEAKLETGKKCSWLSVSALGPVLTVTEEQEAWLLDPATLAVAKRFPVAGARRVASSVGLKVAYACLVDGYTASLRVLDLAAGRASREYTGADFQGRHELNYPAATADGKYLFCTGGMISRYRIDGTTLAVEESSPHVVSGRFDGVLALSEDGKYVAAPSGGGNQGIGPGRQRFYSTHVFAVTDLKRPALTLDQGAYPIAVGFDTKAGLFYAQNHDKGLIVFDAAGLKLKEQRLESPGEFGGTRQFLVHPDGHKLIVLAGHEYLRKPALACVELAEK